jgi:uncharacterized membrane protein (UPF0127 family)
VAQGFLAGAAKAAPPFVLMNERTGRPFATSVEIAGTSETRRRGLLGREGLAESAALVIAPCWAVHTFFMRFVIDIVFVDRGGRVVKIVRRLRPWRMAASLRAYAVVELAGGGADGPNGVAVGDRLYLGT